MWSSASVVARDMGSGQPLTWEAQILIFLSLVNRFLDIRS